MIVSSNQEIHEKMGRLKMAAQKAR